MPLSIQKYYTSQSQYQITFGKKKEKKKTVKRVLDCLGRLCIFLFCFKGTQYTHGSGTCKMLCFFLTVTEANISRKRRTKTKVIYKNN